MFWDFMTILKSRNRISDLKYVFFVVVVLLKSLHSLVKLLKEIPTQERRRYYCVRLSLQSFLAPL